MSNKLRLYQERKQKNLTQVEVATIIGLSKQGYNHIERGRRNPSWEVAQRLEQFFGIPARELLKETDVKNKVD